MQQVGWMYHRGHQQQIVKTEVDQKVVVDRKSGRKVDKVGTISKKWQESGRDFIQRIYLVSQIRVHLSTFSRQTGIYVEHEKTG